MRGRERTGKEGTREDRGRKEKEWGERGEKKEERSD